MYVFNKEVFNFVKRLLKFNYAHPHTHVNVYKKKNPLN